MTREIFLFAILLGAGSENAPADGYSLRFFGNGTGQIDRVKVPIGPIGHPLNVSGDFTVEFRMKARAVENSGTVVAAANGDGWITGNVIIDRDVFYNGDAGDWGISIAGNGQLAFGLDIGGNGRTITSPPGNLLNGQWHHVAVTRAATGRMEIFIDGQRVATIPNGPAGPVHYRTGRPSDYPDSDPFLVFGAEKHDAEEIFGGSYPSFSGWLDEIRISNVIRYEGPSFPVPVGKFAPDAGCVGMWQFDEGAGLLAGDTSSHGQSASPGTIAFGGNPAGPLWSPDTPFGIGARELQYWAFGVIPGQPDGQSRFPLAAMEGNSRVIRYRPAPAAEAAGVLIHHEWSGDLGDWSLPAPAGLVVNRSGDLVSLVLPPLSSPLFFRCRVVYPPAEP